ncbi:MAG TPA: VOC family protein [Terrabacter sp.]|nr:VOC family protein [Terrabacter sp.]
MPLRTTKHWFGVVLDAPDASALAHFYQRLLGWTFYKDTPDWATLAPSETAGYNLSFQTEPSYVRPVWPSEPGEPLMMLHLDLEVDDLEVAVAYAVEVGASVASFQPQEDVRVMLDPAGHPFCLYVDTVDTGDTVDTVDTGDTGD